MRSTRSRSGRAAARPRWRAASGRERGRCRSRPRTSRRGPPRSRCPRPRSPTRARLRVTTPSSKSRRISGRVEAVARSGSTLPTAPRWPGRVMRPPWCGWPPRGAAPWTPWCGTSPCSTGSAAAAAAPPEQLPPRESLVPELPHSLLLNHVLDKTKTRAEPAPGRMNDAELTVAARGSPRRARRSGERVTTPEGVNGELMPIVRMTLPRGVETTRPRRAVPGGRADRPLLDPAVRRSMPIDWDDLMLERLDPPNTFLEHSSMLNMRTWEHERTLEPTPGGGCVVRDRVRVRAPAPVPGPSPAAALQDGLPPPPPRLRRHSRRRLHLESVDVIATADYELVPESAGLVERSDRGKLLLRGARGGGLPAGPGDQRRGGARPRLGLLRRAAQPQGQAADRHARAARRGLGLGSTPRRSAARPLAPHRGDLQPRPRRAVGGPDRRARDPVADRPGGRGRARRRAARGGARVRGGRARPLRAHRPRRGRDRAPTPTRCAKPSAWRRSPTRPRSACGSRAGGRGSATTWTATRFPRRPASTSAP